MAKRTSSWSFTLLQAAKRFLPDPQLPWPSVECEHHGEQHGLFPEGLTIGKLWRGLDPKCSYFTPLRWRFLDSPLTETCAFKNPGMSPRHGYNHCLWSRLTTEMARSFVVFPLLQNQNFQRTRLGDIFLRGGSLEHPQEFFFFVSFKPI